MTSKLPARMLPPSVPQPPCLEPPCQPLSIRPRGNPVTQDQPQRAGAPCLPGEPVSLAAFSWAAQAPHPRTKPLETTLLMENGRSHRGH